MLMARYGRVGSDSVGLADVHLHEEPLGFRDQFSRGLPFFALTLWFFPGRYLLGRGPPLGLGVLASPEDPQLPLLDLLLEGQVPLLDLCVVLFVELLVVEFGSPAEAAEEPPEVGLVDVVAVGVVVGTGGVGLEGVEAPLDLEEDAVEVGADGVVAAAAPLHAAAELEPCLLGAKAALLEGQFVLDGPLDEPQGGDALAQLDAEVPELH